MSTCFNGATKKATDFRVGSPTCTAKLYERAADTESVLVQQDEKLPRFRIM